MVLQDSTTYKNGMDRATILQYAALAAKWKEPPKDALDTLVLNAVDKAPLDSFEQLAYSPFDPSKKRTESFLEVLVASRVLFAYCLCLVGLSWLLHLTLVHMPMHATFTTGLIGFIRRVFFV